MYRFSLAGKKKHTCPNCQKRTFVKYIDNETNQYLPDHYGKCERIHNCGYELNPYKDGYHKGQGGKFIPSAPVHREPSLIPDSIVRSYGRGGDYFSQFLINRFGDKTRKALQAYKVGTADHYRYERGTIFWQVDSDGKVRAGKVMVYNPDTGKRIKDRQNWIHTLDPDLKGKPFELAQVLFGTHLLALPENEGKTICIVESEKTALIASLHFPEYLWLATGGLSNLKAETVKALAGRKVILVPDTSLPNKQGFTAFDLWSNKANHIRLTSKVDITVTDALERIATDTERDAGYDLADYILHCPNRLEGLQFIRDVDNRYLSDRPELFDAVDRAGRKVGIPARTAGGKTTFAVKIGERYNDANDNAVTIIAMPTRALVEQASKKYDKPYFLGKEGIGKEDIMITLFGQRICFTTYQYCARLLPYLKERNANVLTIIDEAHRLATKDFDKAGRDAVNALAEISSKVLYLSGTFTPRFAEIFGCNVLDIETPVRTRFAVDYSITRGRNERETLTVANCLANAKTDVITVVYYNSIKSLGRIASALIGLGLSQDEILTITSETESDAYHQLITSERIPDGVKVVLTTAKLCEGVNILNDNVHLIFVENQTENFQPESIVQIASRFRDVDLLPVTILGRYRDKGKPITAKELEQYESRLKARWDKDLKRLIGEYSTDKEQGLASSFERGVMNRYNMDNGINIRLSALAGEVKEKHHSTLTVETGLAYISKQFHSIASVDTLQTVLSDEEKERIGKGLESNSSKDEQTLEAIAFVADCLTNAERDYLFTYAVNLDYSLLSYLTDRFGFDKMRYHILKNDAGYCAFVQAHGDTLELASVKIRVRDFLTYLHYTDETGASQLVKTVTDAVSRTNLKDELSFAHHLAHKPELPNGLRAVGRDVINDYLNEASKFIGKEIGQGELIRHLRDKFDGETGAIISEREILRLIKCAFEAETIRRRDGKKFKHYLTITRRKTLNMVLSKYNVCNNPPLKHLLNTFSGGVTAQLSNEIHTSNNLIPEIVPVPGAITAGTPTASGYYADFLINGQVETRWIDLSVFDQ
jgi:hypothetical protein